MAKKSTKKKDLKKKDLKKKELKKKERKRKEQKKKDLKKKERKKKELKKKEILKKELKKKKGKKKDKAQKAKVETLIKTEQPEQVFTDRSSNYNARDAVARLRALKSRQEVEAFTKDENRLTVTRAIPPVFNRLGA